MDKKDIPFNTKPLINNIVASGRFPREIDIIKLYEEVEFIESEYEPETYPALLIMITRHLTAIPNTHRLNRTLRYPWLLSSALQIGHKSGDLP